MYHIKTLLYQDSILYVFVQFCVKDLILLTHHFIVYEKLVLHIEFQIVSSSDLNQNKVSL